MTWKSNINIQSLRGHRDKESRRGLRKRDKKKVNQSSAARSELLTSENQDRRKRNRARGKSHRERRLHAFSYASKYRRTCTADHGPGASTKIRTTGPCPGESKRTHRAVPCPGECKRTRRVGLCLEESSWTRTAGPCPGGCMKTCKVDLCPFWEILWKIC